MKLLLTGVAGFLGSHIARASLTAEHTVIGLTRGGTSLSRLADVIDDPRLRLIDVEETGVEQIFASADVDAVIHAATNYGRKAPSAESYRGLIDSNLTLPMSVLVSAINAGVRLFINTDSYFNKPGGTYNSLQGYSLTKKYFLDWLQHHSAQIRVVNMRLEHLYGPDDSSDKFIPALVEGIARRQLPSFPLTKGEQARDFIYVTDAAAAFMEVLRTWSESLAPGYDYFEIGTGATTTVREIAILIKRLSGSTTDLDFGALAYRQDEIYVSTAEPRFRDTFGFSAEVSIEDGVRAILLRAT
jgi:CDP-paratose synthetase